MTQFNGVCAELILRKNLREMFCRCNKQQLSFVFSLQFVVTFHLSSFFVSLVGVKNLKFILHLFFFNIVNELER